MACPHCGYQQQGSGTCPRCGRRSTGVGPEAGPPSQASGPGLEAPAALGRQPLPGVPSAEATTAAVPANIQAVLFVLLVLWALPFLLEPRHPSGLARDLFHLLNLPFALGGRALLAGTGSFGLTLLGPALGGLLAPVLVVGWSLARGSRFGALGGMGWLGLALMDGAIYLEDLRGHLQELLAGCSWPSPTQGWEFHLISRQHALARGAGTLGSLLVIVALALAGALVWRQTFGDRS